ncbi:MAG: 5-formyltetrahydrofolate cyclo-ligase [Oscillospiraceae bacterium]
MSYKVKRITLIGLLTALEIILSRFLSITTPYVKIGFAFVPIVIVAMLYGPMWAGFSAALGDFLGALLIPVSAYFPGFTATAFLTGVIFGMFLYERKFKIVNAVAASAIVCLALNFCLDSLWLYIIMGKGLWGFLPARAVKAAVMFAVQSAAIGILAKIMLPMLKNTQSARVRDLRSESRAYFRGKPELRKEISAQIAEKVLATQEYKNCSVLFGFIGTDRETDTTDIIAAALKDGKRVCIPLCDSSDIMTARELKSLDDLSIGKFGIPEPNINSAVVNPKEIDLALVPCSVCDRKFHRIGKGRGYYDRFLSETAMIKAAICPESLIMNRIPQEAHDIPMDIIITEKTVRRAK